MSAASHTVFKAFLQGCSDAKKEVLLSLLPPHEMEILRHTLPAHEDLTLGLDESGFFLDAIHPSHLIPILKALFAADLPLFLSALHADQLLFLQADLGMGNPLPALSERGRTFIRHTLVQELTKTTPDLLPLSCLPDTPWVPLLFFSHLQKEKLIHLLSMFDLAAELKALIDKRIFSALYELLSQEERELLDVLSKGSIEVRFQSMQLAKWDLDPGTLRTLLKQRGINRLSKALFGCDPSFLWHIKMQLDMPSAILFQRLHTPLENPSHKKALEKSVLELISLFPNPGIPTLQQGQEL